MSILDKIQTPVYDITIPSTKKPAKYRPFFVKEERALLSAYESEDAKIMINTLSSVVENAVTPKTAFPDGLTTYDVEYIFTHIRAKSVGEYSTIILRCNSCNPNEHPDAKSTIRVDLRTVEVFYPNKDDKGLIKLNDRMQVQMKHPKVNDLTLHIEDKEVDKYKAVQESIQTIFIDDDVYTVKDEPPEEIEEFINTLTGADFEKLEDFTKKIPYARIPVEYKCPVCGKEHKKYIRGLKNFF